MEKIKMIEDQFNQLEKMAREHDLQFISVYKTYVSKINDYVRRDLHNKKKFDVIACSRTKSESFGCHEALLRGKKMKEFNELIITTETLDYIGLMIILEKVLQETFGDLK